MRASHMTPWCTWLNPWRLESACYFRSCYCFYWNWLMVWNMFFFHNIWDNPSHWLSYFSEGLKPPTRKSIKAAGPVHFTDMSKEVSKSEKFPAPDDPHFWPKSRHGTQQEDLPRRGNQSSLTWWSYTEIAGGSGFFILTGGLGIDPSLHESFQKVVCTCSCPAKQDHQPHQLIDSGLIYPFLLVQTLVLCWVHPLLLVVIFRFLLINISI